MMDIKEFFVNDAVETLFSKIAAVIPGILGAITVLVTGLILARGLRKIVIKILGRLNFDAFCLRTTITETLRKVGYKASPIFILANLIFWATILFTSMMALEISGFTETTKIVRLIVLYIPNLLVGLLVIIAGLYAATLFKEPLKKKIQPGKYLLVDKYGVHIIQGVIMFAAISMALYQIGIARGLLASVYIASIGSVVLALFLSFGLASVEIARGALTGRVLLRPAAEETPSDLTPKQYQLFIFLKDFVKCNNKSPVIREIQKSLGDKSSKSVVYKLKALQEKGYIKREKGKHRGIVIMK